jgi:hypothetical protein
MCPRKPQIVSATVIAVTLSMVTIACSIGETKYETITSPVQVAPPATKTCDSPFVAPDLQTLKTCGDGKGHCYEGVRVSLPTENLEACDGTQVCLPDKLLKANGTPLKTCKFFIGDAPGACMSILVKDIGAHKDELKQDVCDPDERCAPCVNPLDGTDTKLCGVGAGVHEKDCTGGAGGEALATCCHGAGVCSKSEGIPEQSRGYLDRESCPENKLCTPAALVNGKPVKCDTLGIGGVCLDVCFASMLKSTTMVLGGGCGPTEVCIPCALGKGQGLPGCD